MVKLSCNKEVFMDLIVQLFVFGFLENSQDNMSHEIQQELSSVKARVRA